MEKTSRIGEVFHRLQDPHLVARFQHICGVRGGTSARSPTGSSGGDGDRTHSHNNGAACSHLAGESNDDHDEGGCGGDPSRAKTSSTTTELRQRTVASPTSRSEALNTAEENKGLPQNGATGTATTTTGGAKVDRSGMPRSRLTDETGPGGAGAAAAGAVLTKVKPLRKNSLTGDAGQEFLIENRFLYYLFTLGTELGNELFYITFFPFVSWNVDPFVGRRLIMVWVWVMYLGQCTKDILGWSRPASPPVVKVEMFYNSEYSMPSTHAMSGTAIPVCLFFLTYGRWEYPYPLGVGLALCWCLLVCASRIYMGMHSILDVMAGILYSALILLAILPALDLIDNFNLTCAYAPLINVSFHLLLGLFSFTLDTWSTSRGDTAQILGVGAGVALASHINNRLDFLPDTPLDQLPYCAPVLGVGLVATSTFKLIVGVLVLMVTRAIMKLVTIPVVCRVAGIPSTDVRKARQNMEVELPYRFIVYGAVGLNYQFLVPLLFSYMQLL